MAEQTGKSFLSHATWIAALTLVSRFLGLAREIVAYRSFGADAIWSAFLLAFTVPNLFRKLFGEGALTSAFVPAYTRRLSQTPEQAAGFAADSVRWLVCFLILLTIAGEAILALLLLLNLRPDHRLAVGLSMAMLPYVLMVCGAAFLGAILQVHRRFIAFASAAIVLNLTTIIAIVLCAGWFDLTTHAARSAAVWWLAIAVLIAGLLQVAVLLPSLAAVKFPWSKVFSGLGWKPSPEVKALLITSVPVFISAGVLQIGVLLDRLIAVLLSSAGEFTTLSFLGQSIAYPMAEGAAARLNLAQYLYQFPLGVFAVAISTAIFPALSRQALEPDKTAFAATLRQGILASLVIGLPASAGMMLVAQPTIELLFSSKNFSAQDVLLTAQSCIIYSAAIWAFSVQNILNRAFYALGDNRTPLYWAAGNLLINLVVELPLIFTPLAESGMAVGTLVSFVVQSLFMGWQLSRRLKSQNPGSGLGLHQIIRPALLMLAAALLMSGVCLGFMQLPIYPTGNSRPELLLQLIMIMSAGGLSYFAACQLLGLPVLKYIRRKGN